MFESPVFFGPESMDWLQAATTGFPEACGLSCWSHRRPSDRPRDTEPVSTAVGNHAASCGFPFREGLNANLPPDLQHWKNLIWHLRDCWMVSDCVIFQNKTSLTFMRFLALLLLDMSFLRFQILGDSNGSFRGHIFISILHESSCIPDVLHNNPTNDIERSQGTLEAIENTPRYEHTY